jgi:cation transport ATPase
MRKYPILRNLIVLTIIFLIIYELVISFKNNNLWGMTLAFASMVAFVTTGRMLARLAREKADRALQEERETTV